MLPLLVVLVLPASCLALPRLQCDIQQSDFQRVVQVEMTDDVYGVKTIDINGRFRFKPVLAGADGRIDFVKLYTYYVAGSGRAVLLHQATHLPPFLQLGTDAAPAVHYLYEPRYGHEMRYRCFLLQAGNR